MVIMIIVLLQFDNYDYSRVFLLVLSREWNMIHSHFLLSTSKNNLG